MAHRIIILTPGFAADEGDTSCIPALQDFVQGWKASDQETELKVIAFQYPYHEGYYDWHGIKVYAAGGRNRQGIFKYATWRRVTRQLNQWSDGHSILLSYFLTESAWVAHRFAQRKRLPHLAIAAGQDVKKTNRYLHLINWKKKQVVCFNEQMAALFSKNTGAHCHIIPMGWNESLNGNSNGPRDTDIISAGSLIPVKRLGIAFRVLAAIQKQVPQLRVKVMGSGTRDAPEIAVPEMLLQDHIQFTGKLPREGVLDAMRQSKILLHTSAYEGQATVITEALACGMYVVCFDVGRICDHPKVFVCGSEQEMIEVIVRLLTANQFDFTPVIPFTMKQTIDAYTSLFRQLKFC